jgi:hypothetical protein
MAALGRLGTGQGNQRDSFNILPPRSNATQLLAGRGLNAAALFIRSIYKCQEK